MQPLSETYSLSLTSQIAAEIAPDQKPEPISNPKPGLSHDTCPALTQTQLRVSDVGTSVAMTAA